MLVIFVLILICRNYLMLEFPVYAIESKNYSRKKMNEKATISKLSDKIKVKVDLNNLAKISIVSKNIYIYIYQEALLLLTQKTKTHTCRL